MTDDFHVLTSPDHYLGWMGDDPATAARREIEGLLRRQVPTATLRWVRLYGEPAFLTGGRRDPDNPNLMVLTRAALAVSFELEVRSANGTERLCGVFSWAASGIDSARCEHERVYLDIDAEMDWATDQLRLRILEIELDTDHLMTEAILGHVTQNAVSLGQGDPPPRRPWWAFWRM